VIIRIPSAFWGEPRSDGGYNASDHTWEMAR
jgi:hypothetical protein